MDINITTYGTVEVTDEVTIEADLEDILRECSSVQLMDALEWQGTDWIGVLVNKGDADDIMSELGSDAMEDYIKEHGGGTLSMVSDHDLINEVINRDLEKSAIADYFDRDHVLEILSDLGYNTDEAVEVPADVAEALVKVSYFINGIYFDVHSGTLVGKRFILPN